MKRYKQLTRMFSLFYFIIFFFHLLSIEKSTADVPDTRLNTDATQNVQNEEMIWVSPVDSNVVMAVWRDFRLEFRKVAIGVSTDGGHTWIDSLLKGGAYPRYSDPAIWCDGFGNFYPLTMNFGWNEYGESNLALWKTTDNGNSWTGPHYAVHDTEHGFLEDKEFITIDRTGGPYDGNIYICWARAPLPLRVMFVRSTDGGINWSDTLVLGHPDDFGGENAGQFSFPVVDAYGNVYVFWRTFGEITQQMVKSTDGGQTFTSPKLIMTNNEVWEAPGGIHIYNACAMDADITNGPYRGNIYLAVPDGVSEEPNSPSDIVLIKSTDGGDTWTDPIRVNDDPEGPPVYQFHPWLVVNQEGVIVVFFYDQRNDPPNYEKFDTYITFSFDGGETFTTNYRVSDVSSDPADAYTNINQDDYYQLPPSSSTAQTPPLAGLLGEYIGVSAYYDRIHCIWTDTREGDQNVYYSNFKIPLLPPRIYYPDDDLYFSYTDPQLDFRWAACGFFNEVNYDLEISTDSNFLTLDFLYPVIDTNFYTSTFSLNETTYFWRIKAYKVTDTLENQYSVVRCLTIDTTSPDIPVLVSPADDSTISDTLPEFVWSEVSLLKQGSRGAPVFYTLQVSSDSNFNPGPELLEYSDIYATSFPIPDVLTDYQSYYWRVKAEDQAGNQGDWQNHPFQFWVQVYLYGDTNGDGEVTVSDVVSLIDYVLKSGDPPIRFYTGDANCDGTTEIVDIVYLINYLFKNGPPPCP
jgi:hypothetical protein